MTPAEKLAKAKPWRREPRNRIKQARKATWHECRVRSIRESLRLSMRDVAAAVGMSLTGWWQIEMGGDPQLSTARKIAVFFGKTTDEIWPK